MSPQIPLPNPSLVAIILMIKTNAEERHVFHYPANPGQEKSHIKSDHEHSSEEDSGDSSNDELGENTTNDGQQHHSGIANIGLGGDTPELDESGSVSPEKNDASSWKLLDVSRGGFLGFPVGVQHFFCPKEKAHKKRFEMSIDGLVFLGRPLYARENGEWGKTKRKKSKELTSSSSVTRKNSGLRGRKRNNTSKRTSMQIDNDLAETTGDDTGLDEQEATLMDPDVAGFTNPKAYAEETEKSQTVLTATHKEQLKMFHVVFVMKPSPVEYQIRVDTMYNHVVKKFSRALKWEQSKSNYVLNEAERLRELESKQASIQYKIQHSSLAKAIANLYNSISTSRIAHIDLTPKLSFSLQIPVPTSISILPTANEPQLPGVWLTTANSIPTDDEVHSNRSQLASHFALLLLSDLSTVLAEVTATASPLTGPLTHYLHVSTPTKSFFQISQSHGIPLSDIQFLASHLIYWRKARAVPPLHQRDTYIVSPNADMRKLKSAAAQYAKLFPALPTLPKMLSLLSTAPRPYSTFVPTKAHKEAYFEILAWLLRGGWVTQLRTFAWIRVPSHIRAAVAKEVEREASEDERQYPSLPSESKAVDLGSRSLSLSAVLNDTASPADHLVAHNPPLESDASSLSSARTAIPLTGSSAIATAYPPILILHPAKASGLESRYLAAIAQEIRAAEGKEAGEAWEKCLKYFNGEHALEKIAVREGWKRKGVEALRAGWVRLNVLQEVKHW